MRSTSRVLIVLAIASLAAPAGAAGPNALVGRWLGELPLSGDSSLRLALEIDQRPDGSLGADLISLDQGADGAPSSRITFDDPHVRIDMRYPAVVIEGDLSADAQSLAAEYRQGGFRGPLPMVRVDRLPGLAPRWQTPARPYPYAEEEVSYPGGAPDVTLAGTLTLPPGEGPYPAVVLVSGSGPQGRDELIGYHRPFLVLADHLTRRGIAVLRYDDRGVGQSTGAFSLATTADLADDAQAAVAYLRTRPDLQPGVIGMIGHSEGGMIAPMVASRSPEVSFIVLLAGPGTPITELIIAQIGLFALDGGATEAQAQALRAIYRVIHHAVVTAGERSAIYNEVYAYYDGLTDAEHALLGWPRSVLNAVVESRLDPWWRYFLPFDPTVYLEKVTVPVLALNGDRDLNVPATENLAGIGRALSAGGNPDHTEIEYAGLNHMFNHNGEGEPADTTVAIETISPEVLDQVSSWIRERAGLAPAGTAVAEDLAALPGQLVLAQNYPNPFNGATAIGLSLPAPGPIDLAIYNLAGQRVATVARRELDAGTRTLSWNATTDAGVPVASGPYLYRLEHGGQAFTRRLMLIR